MTTAAATPEPSAHSAAAPAHAAPPNPPFRGDPSAAGRGVSSASSRNATTHGLFSQEVVLPALGEDPAAFDALLSQLCGQLPPRNLLERHYLEQIAAASWRLRRLHRWQAQIYEDPTLTEDERMRRLDSVLRHETALTRQIDRAIRTLNRDLSWLFQGRARDEALYQRDLTEAEVRAEPELGIEVQREVWRRLRPLPADSSPDHAAPVAPPPPQQNCQNENCQNENCQNENCQNEPPAPPSASPPSAPPLSVPPLPLLREAFPQEREGPGVGAALPAASAAAAPEQSQSVPSAHQNCQNEPASPRPRPGAYIAYRKREQEIYNRFHPDRPDTTDWDSDEMRQVYGNAR